MILLKHSSFFLCLIIYLSSSIHSTHGQVMEPVSLWPIRVIIPYEIDPALAPNRTTILAAMREISGKTCIKFVPRVDQPRYLNIKSSKSCNVIVGSVTGGTPLNLSNECVCKGIIMHGLYHAAGAAKPGTSSPAVRLTYNIKDPQMCAKNLLYQAEVNTIKKIYKC